MFVPSSQAQENEKKPSNTQPHAIVTDTTGQQVNPQNLGYGFNNVPYFAQFDQRWGSIQYGSERQCSSYTEAGCGPAAFSMVLKHLNKNVNPTHIGKIAIETQARQCPGGTNSRNKEFLKKIEKDYAVRISIITSNETALQLLKEKKPLIISGPSSGQNNKNITRTYKGHFLVLTGVDTGKKIDSKDIIRVNDPGNRVGRRSITHMSMEQFNKKNRFILIENTTP